MNKSKISFTLKRKVFEKTGGYCYYCGVDLNETWDIDHMTPKTKGGLDNIENLAPSCKKCNSTKGKKTLQEFRSYCAGNVHFDLVQINFLKRVGVYELVQEYCYVNSSGFKFAFETK